MHKAHTPKRMPTNAEVQRLGLLKPNKRGDLGLKDVCYLCGWQHSFYPLRTHQYLKHGGTGNVIVFGESRIYKKDGVVLPTLLDGWQQSVVVYDVGGENYSRTAGYRRSIGNRVIKFNPHYWPSDDPDKGMNQCGHFNPMEEVRVGTLFEVEDATTLATMLLYPDGTENLSQIQKTAVHLLAAVILHVLYAKADKTIRGLVSFLEGQEMVDTYAVFEVMMHIEHDPDGRFGWVSEHTHDKVKTHPFILSEAVNMMRIPEVDMHDVVSCIINSLKIYCDPIISTWMEYSNFSILDLQDLEDPVALFLISSPEGTYRENHVIRLILNMILSKLTSSDRLSKDRKRGLLMLLDDFNNVGKISTIPSVIPFLYAYNIKMVLVAQDRDILEADTYGYGKYGFQTIINNCDVHVSYGQNGDMGVSINIAGRQLWCRNMSYRNDNNLLDRARIPEPTCSDITCYSKDYHHIFGKSGGVVWQTYVVDSSVSELEPLPEPLSDDEISREMQFLDFIGDDDINEVLRRSLDSSSDTNAKPDNVKDVELFKIDFSDLMGGDHSPTKDDGRDGFAGLL